MFQYVESNLLKDEKLEYAVRPHWIVFSSGAWTIFFSLLIWLVSPDEFAVPLFSGMNLRGIACIIVFLLGVYWLISAYIYYQTSEYAVTNKRVVIKVGWIQRRSLELLLDKVEGVFVNQSILGRILDYGTISVIGTGGTRDGFGFVPSPLEFRKNVQQQIELYEEMMRGVVAK